MHLTKSLLKRRHPAAIESDKKGSNFNLGKTGRSRAGRSGEQTQKITRVAGCFKNIDIPLMGITR